MFRDNNIHLNNSESNSHHINNDYKSNFINRNINDNCLMKHYYNQIKNHYNILNNSNPVLPVIDNSNLNLISNDKESIFPNDNTRYLSNYKKYIELKSKQIDSKSEQYLSYMSKEMKKSPNSKQYHNIRNESENSESNYYLKKNTNYRKHQRNISQQHSMRIIGENGHYYNNAINSFHLFTPEIIKSTHSDINNPNYYRDDSENTLFRLLKEKERQILEYNKKVMDNKNKNKKEEIDTNPYRGYKASLGKSYLTNNIILNPVPNVTYNKYLANF